MLGGELTPSLDQRNEQVKSTRAEGNDIFSERKLSPGWRQKERSDSENLGVMRRQGSLSTKCNGRSGIVPQGRLLHKNSDRFRALPTTFAALGAIVHADPATSWDLQEEWPEWGWPAFPTRYIMSISRRQILSFSAAAAISPLLAVRSPAAVPYPARPVRILVGFPAGGTADILARMTGQWLQERLGQPFIVENRPGAATNLATEAVVRAPADGYTLLATTTSNLLNGALHDNMSFDFVRDITPVAGLAVQPLVLTVTPTFPARSVPEFIAYAKAHPGAISMGNFGAGTISHLAAELFKQSTGIDFVDVSYRGSAPMLTDLLGGRIQASFDNIPVTVDHVKSGALRALAVTAASRSRVFPTVPTMGEFLPNYEAMTVAGIGAPRGTHPDIVEKLNAEINMGLATSTLVDRLDELGSGILGGSPDEFAHLIKRETERWAKVIQTAGIKVK